MSSVKSIDNPTIYINGRLWPTAPDTIEITMGYGEQEIKPRSLGNGNIDSVYCESVSTKVGKMAWGNYTTDDTVSFIGEFKFFKNENTIEVDTNSDDDTVYILQGAALTNDPAVPFKAGQTYQLEWSSEPVVQSY